MVMSTSLAINGTRYAHDLMNLETGKSYEGDERIDAFIRYGRKLRYLHVCLYEAGQITEEPPSK